MRTGILTKSMDEFPAGVGKYIFNLVQNLVEIDKKNQYFFIHYKKELGGFYKGKNEIFIKRCPITKLISDSIAFLFFNKHKLDLVHETSQINFLLPTKFKTVITVHDIFFLVSEKNRIKKFFLKFLYRTLFNKTNRIITDSESTKKDIIKYLKIPKSKIKVIYLAINEKYRIIKNKKTKVEKLRKKYRFNFPFILFVGTLEPRKNIPRLIKAFYHLKKKSSFPHQLVIAGKKGWQYQDIFETISQLNITKEVVFPGYIPEKDLVLFYNAAALFIYPSLYEGFGFPPLEAMACGCPVITSNTSSLPEVCGDATYYINPYNTNDIIKAMRKILTDKNLRKRMIRRGLKQTKKFSWKKTAEETLQVYKKVYHK